MLPHLLALEEKNEGMKALLKPDFHMKQNMQGNDRNCWCGRSFNKKKCTAWRKTDLHYFDYGVKSKQLFVYGYITWSDNGFGSELGLLKLRLIRNKKTVAEEMHGPAPPRADTLQLDFTDMCKEYKQGDDLQLAFHVGDSTKRLIVLDLSLYIEVY